MPGTILWELSELLEESRVVIVPGTDPMARAPLMRAVRDYSTNFAELDADQRAAIEERLNQGRMLDAVVEQIFGLFARQIGGEIEAALEAQREESGQRG